ncbi:MAG: serine hydrolase [Gemmatimonadota bacterium]|nr:serine hydrolase [Gemmatimonadota bacterium]
MRLPRPARAVPALTGTARRRALTVALLALAVGGAAYAPASAQAPSRSAPRGSPDADLDAYIAKGLRDWKIPGLSIAIVKNDAVVYAKGFGVRTLGDAAAVDAGTLFGMMSTTKAMTALAVAMLVDSGVVAWDDRVTKHLPWFALHDPYVTRELTVRDLLRHNAGLGNADLLWVRGDFTPRQILERVRHLPLAYSMRDGFVYQNVMYQVAGEVVAAASGMPWDRFVKTRILDPLGMTRSQPTLAALRAANDPNVSSAHFEIDGTTRVISESPVDPVPAAGAAWSSADDAAKWLRFLLDSGRVGGRRLVSENSFRELLKPQAFVPLGEFYPTATLTRPHWMTYGLGWFQQDYQGKFVAMHTGSIDGRTAIIAILPEERLGVYIFGNTDHAEFRHALMWRVIDRYIGAPPRDWSAEFLTLYGDRKAKGEQARIAREAKRVTGTSPSLALAQYAGTYEHPVYGDLTLSFNDGALGAAFGPAAENRGRLEHWQYDTFRARLGDGRGGWTYFSFRLSAGGTVAAVRFDDQADLEFARRQ